ncbi:MAG: glycine--tRNA ligase subunit beta [Gammaproteobacteria bacterium]|nr:glycine--tRNA ligase subunit beta [Gammaproteobacteria bacterium]
MSSTADFLVEIGTEELPPKALRRLEQSFAEQVRAGIEAAGLKAGSQHSFATPRRLAVLISDLQRQQLPQSIEKRGPSVKVAYDRDGNPTQAAQAFAKSCGVALGDLTRLQTNKGEWLLFRTEEPGRSADELLPVIVADALAELPIPKRMRWGNSEVEFVRPVHWVLMLLGPEIVTAKILGTAAGRDTYGHRFHAPQPISVSRPSDYPALLADQGHVVADFEQRRALIRHQAEDAAADLSGRAILDDSVLDEVAALTEWPVPIAGGFDAKFLRLPEEVLIATLQDHQRYFPVRSDDGSLMPNFIAISNLDSQDSEQVRQGNERVVAPRLADAAFFWDQDCRVTLESRREALKQVVFQRKLGNLHEKSARVAKLAVTLAIACDQDEAAAQRAAELAKTDLLTELVGEFPELQGRVGYYYAVLDGETETVAKAIEEQYLPRQAGDPLPATPHGNTLALADRLDTLAGIFAVGKRPTGNKDPFGLRRSALAVLRILIEQNIELDLVEYLRLAIVQQPVETLDIDNLLSELYEFMIDRLKRYCLDGQSPGLAKGSVTPEIFESVRVHRATSPLDFHQRLIAVCRFMQLDSAESLAIANKRIANILKSATEEIDSKVNKDLFEVDEERVLYSAVGEILEAHTRGLEERNYTEVLERLAGLREPVDKYFDTVMVMADDPSQRRNRLALMSQLRQLFLDVADLSCIPSV